MKNKPWLPRCPFSPCRLSLAKKADAGKITPDQYTQRLHKLEAKIAAQKAARANKATANNQ